MESKQRENDTRNVLVPYCYEEFVCDGRTCGDNCCMGQWCIFVDEYHYHRLKNIQDPDIREKIDKHLIRNKNSTNEEEYGMIVKDQNSSCAFLSSDCMCTLQKAYGVHVLGNVCMTYPRNTNSVYGELEKTLSLSCPIAAKLLLSDKEGIRFQIIQEPINTRHIINNKLSMGMNENSTIKEYFHKIRNVCVQILKAREYEIWERVCLLGMMCLKIDKDAVNIPMVLDKFTRGISLPGTYREPLSKLNVNALFQLKILVEIGLERFAFGSNECGEYFKLVSDALQGINYRPGAESLGDHYLQAYQEYGMPFLRKNEYILENYLVNYIYFHVFPYSPEKTVFESFMMLAVHYALIRLLVIGHASYLKGNITSDTAIGIIQKFVKTVEHNSSYIMHIYNLMKINKFEDLAHMIMLLKL